MQAFLIDLARFVEARGWLVPQDFGQTERLAAPVVELAGKALSKRWKKVSKHARGLETLDVEQRHELRKELKKLRYAVEFFSPLYPAKRAEPFLKQLKKLQAVFGDLNDAAVARAMLTGAEAPGAGDPAAQRAIGWVIGASQARAEFGWAQKLCGEASTRPAPSGGDGLVCCLMLLCGNFPNTGKATMSSNRSLMPNRTSDRPA